jgi:hypothetical protein
MLLLAAVLNTRGKIIHGLKKRIFGPKIGKKTNFETYSVLLNGWQKMHIYLYYRQIHLHTELILSQTCS